METYIKLYRRFQDWGWYKDSATKAVFIELLLRARYLPKEHRGIVLQAGQCIVGRKELAEATGLSEQNVRTALDHLKSTSEITIKPTNRFSIVTIENWGKYQGGIDEGNQQSNQPANQQLTTKKESKERIKKESRKFNPPTLEEVQQYIADKGMFVDPKYFFDFFNDNDWYDSQGKPVLSWKQKCITWNKREVERRAKGQSAGEQQYSKLSEEWNLK